MLGVRLVTAPVPFPIKSAPDVRVVVPVPPWSTPTVPEELRIFEASEKTTLEAVKAELVKLPATLKVPPTLLLPVLEILAKVLVPTKV